MNGVLANIGISIIFGFIGILLLVFGYWFFDKVLTKLDFNQELKQKKCCYGYCYSRFYDCYRNYNCWSSILIRFYFKGNHFTCF